MTDTTTVRTLTASGALKALNAAHATSLELGVPVNIAVCDAAGNELAFLRPDGAALPVSYTHLDVYKRQRPRSTMSTASA